MRLLIFLILSLVATENIIAQQTFLPDIVSTDSIEFNTAFSPDSMLVFFSKRMRGKTRILFSRREGYKWTSPTDAPFNEELYSDADAAFSPSGELYFISNRPTTAADTVADYNIWHTSFVDGNTWLKPQEAKVLNSPKHEFYISFTDAGDIYFSSSREGGFGEEDIYISRLKAGEYQTPENIGPMINSIHSEYDPFVDSKGNVLIFASSGRPGNCGKADLYWSTKGKKNWTSPEHLPCGINTPTRDYCPYLTKDNLKFFFSSEGDITFISVDQLPTRLHAALKNKRKR